MFDTLEFLNDHFGDADGVIGLLAKHGLSVPKRNTAQKWFSRGSVPWEWGTLLIIAAGKEAGRPIEIGEYIKGVQHDIFD